MIDLKQMLIAYLEANDIELEVVLDALGAELTMFDANSGTPVAICKRATLEEALCVIMAHFASTVRDAKASTYHPFVVMTQDLVTL